MEENKSQNLKIGVALGGGSALGFAHVGALKALEESQIHIDYISGTSVGAIISSLYAFGVTFSDIEKEAKKMDWNSLTKIRPSSMGIFSNANLKKMLEKHIGKKPTSKTQAFLWQLLQPMLKQEIRLFLQAGMRLMQFWHLLACRVCLLPLK